MPRGPRIQVAGGLYHVTSLGAAGRLIFTDTTDRRAFLHILAKVVPTERVFCAAYCLMGTHYHLLIETPEANLSATMHRINGSYAQWFNRRHGTRGHVFASRFGAERIEGDGHLFETIRYIALNPVRADLCATAREWEWSSYTAALGLERAPPFLAVERLVHYLGEPAARAHEQLRRLVEGPGPGSVGP